MLFYLTLSSWYSDYQQYYAFLCKACCYITRTCIIWIWDKNNLPSNLVLNTYHKRVYYFAVVGSRYCFHLVRFTLSLLPLLFIVHWKLHIIFKFLGIMGYKAEALNVIELDFIRYLSMRSICAVVVLVHLNLRLNLRGWLQ